MILMVVQMVDFSWGVNTSSVWLRDYDRFRRENWPAGKSLNDGNYLTLLPAFLAHFVYGPAHRHSVDWHKDLRFNN